MMIMICSFQHLQLSNQEKLSDLTHLLSLQSQEVLLLKEEKTKSLEHRDMMIAQLQQQVNNIAQINIFIVTY